MNKQMITKSAQETQEVGKELAQSMRGGEVLLLSGDLGAGKTTFMQGFAEGLGVSQRIISPTFIIMRSYEVPDKTTQDYSSRKQSESRSLEHNSYPFIPLTQTISTLYHIDLYRTESEADLEGLGIKEIMREKNAVVAIEWPEKLGSLAPENRVEIRFSSVGTDEREIQIQEF